MKRYQVSKHFFITAVLLIIGLVTFGIYGYHALKISNATDYVTENSEKFRNGKVVRIVIDQFLYSKNGSVTGSYNGVSYLNVPVSALPRKQAENADRYVLLGINGKKSVEKISQYKDGKGDPITITAKVEPFFLTSFDWYEKSVPEFDTDKLIQTCELREVNKEDYDFLWITSIACLVLSLISFLTIGRISVVYVRPFEDSSDYKDCFFGHGFDLEKRYAKELENIKIYHRQMLDSWKSLCVGACMLIGGFLLILLCWLLGTLIIPLAIIFYGFGTVAGAFVMIASLRWFWEGFINSNSELAYKLSYLCLLRTPSVKLDESSKLVAVLKKHLDGEPEKNME